MDAHFTDRQSAGEALAGRLRRFAGSPDAIVLGLPPGGIPVAHEVAQRLQLPLDFVVVRQLGVPGQEELAMAAVASGGGIVRNESVLARLNIDPDALERVRQQESSELRRHEQHYRGERPSPSLRHRTVILVDDGLANDAAMLPAVQAVRGQNPREIIVAVPVASTDAVASVGAYADEVAAVLVLPHLTAIGQFYENFSQTDDEEVIRLLASAARLEPAMVTSRA
jgi:predicted phosphoribosyltransferase